MQIVFKIHKKRGYVRPLLTYKIELADHEKALCLPAIRFTSSILEPVDSWQEHCWPGQYERANPPKYGAAYTLDIPSHQGRSWEQSLRLVWRKDNDYLEVAESFKKMREIFEAELSLAYASKPMDIEECLQATAQIKQQLAPGVLADRFLQLTRHISAAS